MLAPLLGHLLELYQKRFCRYRAKPASDSHWHAAKISDWTAKKIRPESNSISHAGDRVPEADAAADWITESDSFSHAKKTSDWTSKKIGPEPFPKGQANFAGQANQSNT